MTEQGKGLTLILFSVKTVLCNTNVSPGIKRSPTDDVILSEIDALTANV